MSQSSRTSFTSLNLAEKQSKLWQLSQSVKVCTLWLKGSKSKLDHRVQSYQREDDVLTLLTEDSSLQLNQEVLGTFDLKGVSFFFKATIVNASENKISLAFSGDFFKSERRNNFRLLAYPIYNIYCLFDLPEGYHGGSVIDFKSKMSQTGLFKSFLKLVDGDPQNEDLKKTKLRIQDLSVTGLSLSIGEAELEWLRAGELLAPLIIQFPDLEIEVSKPRIVYIVDYVGHSEKGIKKYKVGIKFEDASEDFDMVLSKKN